MGDEADTRVFNIGESSIDSRFSESEKISELQAIAVDDNGDGEPDYTIKRSAATFYTDSNGDVCEWTFTVTKK